ncbi:hypothetical protein ACIHDR_46825 [Nocardia sp. NPDC052278]|uniref:hypothetical protein n=1 Tax=unclassified Nocardia TaxID=2637762 RepID=UPI0036B23B00
MISAVSRRTHYPTIHHTPGQSHVTAMRKLKMSRYKPSLAPSAVIAAVPALLGLVPEHQVVVLIMFKTIPTEARAQFAVLELGIASFLNAPQHLPAQPIGQLCRVFEPTTVSLSWSIAMPHRRPLVNATAGTNC